MSAVAPPAMERRAFQDVQPKGRRLEGYAATFGTETRIGPFTEVIAPGAFAASLGGDVLALMDHSPSIVLGRTRSGTLRLSEDSKGLAFSLDLPETQAGRDIMVLAERGDLGGMSFGFTVSDGGEDWQGQKRTLRAINLVEISVVSAWAAYPETEIALRAARGGQTHLLPSGRGRRLILAELGIWV